MALFDTGGLFNPSEPAQPDNPPLPAPPVSLPDFGGMLGGVGLGISQGLFRQSPQQLGQDFSNLGSMPGNAWGDASSFAGNNASLFGNVLNREGILGTAIDMGNPSDMGLIGAQTAAGVPSSPNQPTSGDEVLGFAGRGLNQGLQGLADNTQPLSGGPAQVVHGAAVLGQGFGDLLQDTGSIDQEITQSFQEGLRYTFSNDPNAEAKIHDAGAKLLDSMGRVTNDIFDPKLMHTMIRDNFLANGSSAQDANHAADYMAGPLSTIASFVAPGGMGKVMMAQFIGQIISDPGAALKSFTDLNPSGQGQQQTTGDFVNLFNKTRGWMSGQSGPPTPDEVNKGFSALAYDVGLGFMSLHAGKDVLQTPSAFKRGLTGSDPSGAKDIVNGTADIGQTNQAGITGETSLPSPGSEASSPSAAEAVGGAGETGTALPTAEQNQVPQGEGVPEADTVPVPSKLVFFGDGIADAPDPVKDQIHNDLQATGLNNDGLINAVFDHSSLHPQNSEGDLGSWSPQNPNIVGLNPDVLNPEHVQGMVDNLQKDLDAVAKTAEANHPAIAFAQKLLSDARAMLTPSKIAQEVLAHEAIHAGLSRLSGFEGQGYADHNWIPMMAQAIYAHLSSTPEGRDWLEDTKNKQYLDRQIADIEAFGNTIAGESDPRNISAYLNTLAQYRPEDRNRLEQSAQEFFEHITHQVANGKKLSSIPFTDQAGPEAASRTFWEPQAAAENAKLAARYFDAHRYSTSLPDRTVTRPAAAEPIAANKPPSIGPATNRSGNATAPDQARVALPQQAIDKIVQGVKDAIKARVDDAKAGIPQGPTRIQAQENHGRYSKALNLRAAALIRQITGNLTGLEMKAVTDKISGNYVGKRVSVEGLGNGVVTKNAFGRTVVKLEDGTEKAFDAGKLTPLDDKATAVQQELQRIQTAAIQRAKEEFGVEPGPVQGPSNPPTPQAAPRKNMAADYRQEAIKISEVGPKHKFAALKPLAQTLRTDYDNLIKAMQSGLSANDLASYAKQAQISLTKFKAAYDLYGSATFKAQLEKDHPAYKATRNIAREVESAPNTTPTDRALMAAHRMGLSLEDARKAMVDSVLGLSRTAANWHPDYKILLMGQLGDVVRKVRASEPSALLGLEEIHLADMLETSSIQDLRDGAQIAKAKYKADRAQQESDLLALRTKMNQNMPGAKEAYNAARKAMIEAGKRRSLESLQLEARIANHPDLHQSRVANQPPMTDADIADAQNVNPAAHVTQIEQQAEQTATMTDQDLAKEAQGRNGRLATASPNMFDPATMAHTSDPLSRMQEGEEGGPPPTRNVMQGAEFFPKNYNEVLSALRTFGGTPARLADRLHSFLVYSADHFDPSENMFHPAQQFKAAWERIVGVPWHVRQVRTQLDKFISDQAKATGVSKEEVGRRILRPIDNLNEAERMQHLSVLTPQEAAVANMLNVYWKATGRILSDPEFGKPAVQSFVDSFVPHTVLAGPDGTRYGTDRDTSLRAKLLGGKAPTDSYSAAVNRVTDGLSKEPIFKTRDALRAAGYKLEEDLGKLFEGHATAAMKAVQIRKMIATHATHIYKSPDGSFVGPAIIHRAQWDAYKKDPAYTGLDKMRQVSLGVGARIFDDYRVHPELAAEIEKLSKIESWGDPGKIVPGVLRALAGIFKFTQFSFNPMHALRVYSNIAVLGDKSKLGILDPTLLHRIWGRANDALSPEDRSYLHRAGATAGRVVGRDTEAAHLAVRGRLEAQILRAGNMIRDLGFDPNQAPNPDDPKFAQAAKLYDDLNKANADLIAARNAEDASLHARDRRNLGEMMGKGLTPPREIHDSADLGWLTHLQDKVPGWFPIFGMPLKQFHQWMWKDVVWNGMVGVSLHLSDQLIMRTARDLHNWNGKGGAEAAESLLTPQERDAAQRQAIYYAKMATGLMGKLDMSLGWQQWGRATLISAPWTISQFRAVRDSIPSNPVTRKLGRSDRVEVSDRMLESGFGRKQATYFDGLHTKLARRMLLGGTMRMSMMGLFAQQVMSLMTTGQMANSVQNYQRDPLHMFDVYVGQDPATHKDLWLTSGFYGFQREMIDYVMAGLKAYQEGKGPVDVAKAPFIRFSSKFNPAGKLPIEEITNTEIGKWLNNPDLNNSITGDTDLQALQAAMDAKGVPDNGSTTDRLGYAISTLLGDPHVAYAMRTMLPGPGLPGAVPVKRDNSGQIVRDENNMPIPLDDPRSVLTKYLFNFGQFTDPMVPAGASPGMPADPMKLAGYLAGTSISETTDVGNYLQQQQQFAQNDISRQQTVGRDQALGQLATAAANGDMATVQTIRDANGFTDGQVLNAIEYGVAYNVNGRTKVVKGILSNPAGGAAKSSQAPVTIGNYTLNDQESQAYNDTRSNRETWTITQLLMKNPNFQNATTTEKAQMIRQYVALSDRFTLTQAEQVYNQSGGQPIKDEEFVPLMQDAFNARATIKNVLYQDPQFWTASPTDQQKMLNGYSTMADTIAWDQRYGTLKSLNDDQITRLISDSVHTEQSTKDYLMNTPFFQQATPQEQNQMLSSYSTLSRQMTMNLYNGKLQGVNHLALPQYMQTVVNTEGSAMFLLHQSQFYQDADLKTQQALDSKYQTMARSLANTDWRQGKPVLQLSMLNNAYEVGHERVVTSHLMADQAFSDLQNQYGGAQTITSYANELSSIRKDVRENVDASPKTITYLENAAQASFLRANPQYAAYLQARSVWENRTSLGQMYKALNADEQSLAAADSSALSDVAGVPSTVDQSVDTSVANLSAGPAFNPYFDDQTTAGLGSGYASPPSYSYGNNLP